jgi:AraC-like DNA-binding protein
MNWMLFVLVAGAFQGLLLSIALLRKNHKNEKANRWLAAFIFVFVALTIGEVLNRTVEYHNKSALLFLSDWMIFLLAPLMFMYIKEMTGERNEIGAKLLLHLIPSLFFLLLLLPIYFMPSSIKIKIAIDDLTPQKDILSNVLSLIIFTQMGIYILWGFAILRRYSRRLREHYSDLGQRNLRWLHTILAINMALWILSLLQIFTSSDVISVLNDLAFPIVVYVFGYLGLAQADLEPVRAAIAEDVEVTIAASKQNDTTPDRKPDESANRYVRSGLTAEKAAILKQKLDTLMLNERPYLEDDLNLRELADRLEVFPHHLSQLLNEHYDQNFFDYINSYRAQEVKNMLSNPTQKDESILSIAFSCGFNSKATFNTFFKKQTGQTPRQFRADCESKKG